MAPRRFPAVLAASLLCCLPLAACGSDDEDGGGSSADVASASFEASEGSGGKVELSGPKTVEAGAVELELVNAGKDRHDVQLYRVTGDRSPDELIGAVMAGPGKPMPRWAVADGGVGTVQPGERAAVTQVLQPGSYYLVDSEQGAGGKPNALRGGVARLEVTGEEEVAAELPDADATVTARDYAFETDGLRPGRNRLVFDNVGKQPHHVIAMPLLPGAKPAEVEQFLTSEKPPQGPPPVDFENGVSTAILDGGTAQVAELELAKGRYALVCFISNREGGPPHATMGMIDTVEVR